MHGILQMRHLLGLVDRETAQQNAAARCGEEAYVAWEAGAKQADLH